tara:strand:- start:557 stop:1003 length:447 start_codon:yes stop_codon:yes gene_type:complete
MGNRVIIVDLDGTISDPAKRLHLYKKGDYEEFNKAGKDDLPIENICNIIRGLKDEETDVSIVTARDASVRKETLAWLNLHDVPFDSLLMRAIGDNRSDADVKLNLLNDEFLSLYDFKDIWFVLEDRGVCVDMWRGEGLTCLQVAPGDF